MQDNSPYQYDEEVVQLVDSLNSEARFPVSRVIDNPDSVLDKLNCVLPLLPRERGIDWNKAFSCTGPFPDDPPETLAATTQRVLADFQTLCRIAALESSDRVSFVSDDFYSKGIECNVASAQRVLKEWLPLPQAIYVAPANLAGCQLVTFSRSSYVFRSALVSPQLDQRDCDLNGQPKSADQTDEPEYPEYPEYP